MIIRWFIQEKIFVSILEFKTVLHFSFSSCWYIENLTKSQVDDDVKFFNTRIIYNETVIYSCFIVIMFGLQYASKYSFKLVSYTWV